MRKSSLQLQHQRGPVRSPSVVPLPRPSGQRLTRLWSFQRQVHREVPRRNWVRALLSTRVVDALRYCPAPAPSSKAPLSSRPPCSRRWPTVAIQFRTRAPSPCRRRMLPTCNCSRTTHHRRFHDELAIGLRVRWRSWPELLGSMPASGEAGFSRIASLIARRRLALAMPACCGTSKYAAASETFDSRVAANISRAGATRPFSVRNRGRTPPAGTASRPSAPHRRTHAEGAPSYLASHTTDGRRATYATGRPPVGVSRVRPS